MKGVGLDTALLVATGGLWGSAFIAIRAGLLAGATPFLYAAIRLILAMGIMAAVALASRERRPPVGELLRSAALGSLCLMGGYAALLYWGEQTTPGSLATILVASAPLQSALFAVLLIPADRLGRLGSLGVVAGFAGVAAIFVPGFSGTGPGPLGAALAVFGAATLFALGSVILRRLGGGRQSYWHMVAQFSASAGLLAVLTAATWPTERFPSNVVTWGTVIYLAAGSSVLGYALYFRLHHRIGPQQANAVAYVNPVVGVVLGVLLLGESVAWFEVVGFALVVTGLALLHFERARRPAPR
ncbi:MAG TPA: EamA family transporter [Thermoplasmata archaeon]|nr:EamA family transporter [Thermoplasmata archaeon]